MLPRPLGLIFFLVTIFTLCTAQSPNNPVCVPWGICERCPEEALHQPFCQPFGNRRLMHCPNSTSSDSSSSTTTDSDTSTDTTRPHYAKRPPFPLDFDASDDGELEEGTILAWESCGRVVSTERADFFEFVAVNLLFVCVSVGVVIWRSRRLRLLHARQLAARIGMVGRRR